MKSFYIEQNVQNCSFCLEKNIMKPKRLKTTTAKVRQILDDIEEYDDNSTTTTNSAIIISSSNSSNDNSSPLTTDNNNLISPTNTTESTSPSDNINSTAILSLRNNITGRKSSSNVWYHAKKSDDGKTAYCNLCDYTCVIAKHSTSTIRNHLIREHYKYDLIIEPSEASSTKPRISEHLKNELHAMCYNSIIVDHRPFNDFMKKGIVAIFNKIIPGNV
jgi:hypothetical protein